MNIFSPISLKLRKTSDGIQALWSQQGKAAKQVSKWSIPTHDQNSMKTI
jgi:hypothetical protein